MNGGSIGVAVYALAFRKGCDLYRGEIRFTATGHNPEVRLNAVYPCDTNGHDLRVYTATGSGGIPVDLGYSDDYLRKILGQMRLEADLTCIALRRVSQDWEGIFARSIEPKHYSFELPGIRWEYCHAPSEVKPSKVVRAACRYKFRQDAWVPKSWRDAAKNGDLVDAGLPDPFHYATPPHGFKDMESGLDDILKAFEDSD